MQLKIICWGFVKVFFIVPYIIIVAKKFEKACLIGKISSHDSIF